MKIVVQLTGESEVEHFTAHDVSVQVTEQSQLVVKTFDADKNPQDQVVYNRNAWVRYRVIDFASTEAKPAPKKMNGK